MFWEILKSSKGLPVDGPIAALWGQKMSGGWAVTELTGELPLTFVSDGGALKNYRIYGTAGGSGTATGGSEPAGYKIPLTVAGEQQSTGFDIYIGDTKLGEEECVDYREQKIYKNLVDWSYTIDTTVKEEKPCVRYKFTRNVADNVEISAIGFVYISKTVNKLTIDTEGAEYNESVSSKKTGFVRFPVEDTGEGTTAVGYVVVNGTYIYSETLSYMYDYVSANEPITLPSRHLVYPTDPPAPLPAINTYKGENTLSSTEAVGSVTIRGRIKEST